MDMLVDLRQNLRAERVCTAKMGFGCRLWWMCEGERGRERERDVAILNYGSRCECFIMPCIGPFIKDEMGKVSKVRWKVRLCLFTVFA